jgi:hypothetical protein
MRDSPKRQVAIPQAALPQSVAPLSELQDSSSPYNEAGRSGKQQGSTYSVVLPDGTQAIAVATGGAPTDPWTVLGSLSTLELIIDAEFGWSDNIQAFAASKGNGTTEPVWKDMGNGLYAYHFTAADELFVVHHVNHDYKLGSNAYPHVHFLADEAMNAGEQITWNVKYTIAKGHQQGQSLTAIPTNFDMTYIATGTEIAGEHIILECSDLQAFDLIEPDALILVGVTLVSKNVSGKIFGILHDLHYETDRLGTINKSPNFYN